MFVITENIMKRPVYVREMIRPIETYIICTYLKLFNTIIKH